MASQTFTANGTFNVPAGVYTIVVECWGGGGAGGGTTTNSASRGGGGAGGQYARKQFSVVPYQAITVTVGGTKAGGTGDGGAGNDTWFSSNDSNGCVAKGGAGGQAHQNGAAKGSGSTTNGVGDIVQKGGDGSAGGTGTTGGAGGGGAGSTGDGGNAAGNTQGTGTASNGGDGGAGRSTVGNGNPGNNYGGGGSSGYTTSSTDRTGGTGAQGLCVVNFQAPKRFRVKPR